MRLGAAGFEREANLGLAGYLGGLESHDFMGLTNTSAFPKTPGEVWGWRGLES